MLFRSPTCQFLLNSWTPDPHVPFLNWLRGQEAISWPAAVTGAFVGTYSHVFLDSIMHADMQPFAPLSDVNGLLRIISVGALHNLCVLSGVLGALVLFVAFLGRRGASTHRSA